MYIAFTILEAWTSFVSYMNVMFAQKNAWHQCDCLSHFEKKFEDEVFLIHLLIFSIIENYHRIDSIPLFGKPTSVRPSTSLSVLFTFY